MAAVLADALVRVVPWETRPAGPVAPLLAEGPEVLWRSRFTGALRDLGATEIAAVRSAGSSTDDPEERLSAERTLEQLR